MKKEIEFLWMVNLRTSNLIKGVGFGKQQSGCIMDFERVAGASEKNNTFRRWFKEMVNEGVFEFFEKRKVIGGCVDCYVIIKKLLDKRISQNPLYSPTMKALEDKFLVPIRTG